MKARRTARKAARDADDMVREGTHRAQAGLERGKRVMLGDTMTAGQKTKSTLKEAGHRVAAGAHRTKRKLRDRVQP